MTATRRGRADERSFTSQIDRGWSSCRPKDGSGRAQATADAGHADFLEEMRDATAEAG